MVRTRILLGRLTLSLVLSLTVLLGLIDCRPTFSAGNGAVGRRLAGIDRFSHGEKTAEEAARELKEKATPLSPSEKRDPAKPITIFEDEEESTAVVEEPLKQGEVTFLATIAVPHLKKAISQVIAYPYPMKPPPKKVMTRMLPEKDKVLRSMMLSSGYFSRPSLDIPYPPGGWRWQYAYRKAIQNSDMSMPHTIVEHYSWADRMLPFVKEQVKVFNNFEKQRVVSYQEAVETYNLSHTQYEDSAMKRGLTPVGLRRVQIKSKTIGMNFAANLPQGKWWFLATHRVPGLKYYWLLPHEVTGEDKRIVLNEANAIYIEGGW